MVAVTVLTLVTVPITATDQLSCKRSRVQCKAPTGGRRSVHVVTDGYSAFGVRSRAIHGHIARARHGQPVKRRRYGSLTVARGSHLNITTYTVVTLVMVLVAVYVNVDRLAST